jgi:tRNA U34 5-methylaminomethyl-2-thiouridine-forming methyltransferase MnmC
MTEVHPYCYRHPRTGEWSGDREDPLREARERFVLPAMEWRPPRRGRELKWIEVGFGRGLNSLVALEELTRLGIESAPARVEVLGLEPHPERLEPWPELAPVLAACAPWWGCGAGPWAAQERPWSGEILPEAAPEGLPGGFGADWIFLDLHSPSAHPDDWRPGLAAGLTAAAAPGAVLTSYCCARALKDGLRGAGWRVERLRRRGVRDSLRAVLLPEGGGNRSATA